MLLYDIEMKAAWLKEAEIYILRLKEILILYYEVPSKDVKGLNKPNLIKMLESKFDEEEDRDKAGDQPPSIVTMAFGTLI